jgi:tetratricopeptide (TPR) repeat protein
MKNPLVDALRQANEPPEEDARGLGSEQEPDHKHDKILPIVDGIAPVEHAFDLVESVVLPESLGPTTAGTDETIDFEAATLLEDSKLDAGDVREVPEDDETRILPVLDEQEHVSAVACDMPPAIVLPSQVVAGRQCSQHWISRVARWSPIITMLALSSAAGAYALYQYLTVSNLNYDLGEMMLRAGTDTATDSVTDDWSDLPENSVVIDPPGYVQLNPVSKAAVVIAAGSGSAKSLPAVSRQVAHPTTRTALPRISDPAFGAIRSGFEAYQAGEFARAEGFYRDAISIDANHRQALAGLAAVLQITASPAEWLPIYEKLLEVDPHNTVAVSVLLAHEVTGDAEQKQTRLRVLLQKHPDAAELHLAMGLLAGESGHWSDARLAFLKAHSAAPANANYSFNAAVSMEHLGHYDEARVYYQLAMDTVANNPLVSPEIIAAQIQKMTTYAGISQ